MYRRSDLVLALLITFSFVRFASAWNSPGHQIVAEVAWQKLSQSDRSKVVTILRKHPRFPQDFAHSMQSEISLSQ
jgi:hypothetical protein